MSNETFLDVRQVATRLNVSVSTVYRLAKAGQLPSIRHGQGKIRPRGLRVPEAAVTEYLQGSTQAIPEEIAS